MRAAFANSFRVPCPHELHRDLLLLYVASFSGQTSWCTADFVRSALCLVTLQKYVSISEIPILHQDGFSNVCGLRKREGVVTCLWSNLGYFGDLGWVAGMRCSYICSSHVWFRCTWVTAFVCSILGDWLVRGQKPWLQSQLMALEDMPASTPPQFLRN